MTQLVSSLYMIILCKFFHREINSKLNRLNTLNSLTRLRLEAYEQKLIDIKQLYCFSSM